MALPGVASPDDDCCSAPNLCVARQAKAYIDAHYMDAVHIKDLCRVTGVGVRTLQRCFRECLNITGSNYLKTVRLEAARRELAASSRDDTSVTTIAMHNGYTHLGRFSVEFRERYGVSPRELLASKASASLVVADCISAAGNILPAANRAIRITSQPGRSGP